MTRPIPTILIASSAALAVLVTVPSARAQRRPCVEETTPPPSPGEQAECWFGRQEYAQAAAWCERADLSDEASGNLCFTAYVRSGRFDDAARVAGTLERVRPAARACHEAFTSGLRARIVPNPASGVVTVDDEAYGRGPAEVMLAPPFWDHRVSVRFGSRTVRVSEQRVRRALDRETCAARDVVVDGESGTASDGGNTPVPAIVTAIAGGGIAMVGALLLVWAELEAQDLASSPYDGDQENRIDTLRPIGWVGVGVGLAALTVGGIWAVATGGTGQ